jgi:two-component system, NtrC family, sensor kinase
MEIMIVEDDRISRRLLEKIAADMGHTTIVADNGRDAWQKFQHNPVQLIITDWMMPEMDGLELCCRIRSEVCAHYTYIITLTSRSQKTDLLEVFEAGSDDYIVKPFDPQELQARIKTGQRVVDLEEGHRRLQDTLIESRNKIQVVFDSLQEEIVSVDEALTIVSANRRFLRIMGGGFSEYIGKKATDACRSDGKQIFKPEVIQRIETVFAEGSGQHFLDAYPDNHGDLCYHQIACLPIKGNEGCVEQVVIVTNDITEDRRKTEAIKSLNQCVMQSAAQLEAKNASLEEALTRLESSQAQIFQQEKMASIGQLAAGVAHEINNPTGFVSSNLKALQEYFAEIDQLLTGYQRVVGRLCTDDLLNGLPTEVSDELVHLRSEEKRIDVDFVKEDICDLIQDCRKGTDRITKIVVDLKNFSHPGNASRQYTDINKGLESTLNVVNNEIKYKAKVITDFGEIPMVECFAQELNQVFMNILVNAAQAMEKSGEIRVQTRLIDDCVRIEISDTGPGIHPDHLNKIFDPFFTTKEVGKGTGLGMHIAYNIIQKHHGSIRADSQPGKGATFIIDLPVLAHEAA